jgi:hypothetical protein
VIASNATIFGRRPRSWITIAVVAVTTTLASEANATVQATDATASVRGPVAELPGTTFTSFCRFSHRNFDDMIMFPGRPGMAHDHTYVGNRSTSARSTLSTLRLGGTTCHRKADTAAYWVPTLLDPEGRPVTPKRAVIYYRRRTVQPSRAFPAGLRMIAGDMTASSPQPLGVTSWSCSFSGSHPMSADIPRCPPGPRTMLAFHVTFPNCWNGLDLDSEDHQRHMSRALNGVCPSTHPIEVPTISLTLRYPVRGGNGFTLASGGQHSGHADFVNSWNQAELERLVGHCLNTLAHCGRGRH